MGLSASQARFLQLIARKTNIEYQGQQINQKRLTLANSSAGLFEKMLSLEPPTPPSSQDDKYYTQGYNFIDERDGLQKKITWQTYADAIASGAPDAASYYSPAFGLTVLSAVDGSSQFFGASVIANPTEVQKQALLDALGIDVNVITETTTIPSGLPIYQYYNDAHTITSAADFVSKIQTDPTGNFIFANDIDFSATPLTNCAINTFSGNLDGNGFAINNLALNPSAGVSNVGLFRTITGGSISNLNIYNATITLTGTNNNVGLLAGNTSGTTSLTNVNTSGSITSPAGFTTSAVAGLVGFSTSGGHINDCSSNINMTLNGTTANSIGGLVGRLLGNANIHNSYSTGSIAGSANFNSVGGLVGFSSSAGSVNNTYSTIDINVGAGSDNIGGLFGKLDFSVVSNSYASSSITAGGGFRGALVGSDEIGAPNNPPHGNITNTCFYDNTDGHPAIGNIGSLTNNSVSLTTAQIAAGILPISGYAAADWITTGAIPTLTPYVFTPTPQNPSTITTSLITGVSPVARAEIRYVTIENPIYVPDGNYVEKQEQGIAVLEFDNLNRLLKITMLTDKDTIDATSGAAEDDKAFSIGDGDALTYSGEFDKIAFDNDINKYEYKKAAYNYQIEQINKSTKQVQSQDKSLELKMKQLDTEHNAVQTEMEAVQKVINKNIEGSFKTFA